MKRISGINTPLKGGMAVLKPFDINALSPDGYIFTRWLAALPWWTPLMMLAIIWGYPTIAYAQSGLSIYDAFDALWRWMPFLLLSGFSFNVLISFWTLLIGTVAGVTLGLGQISPFGPLRAFSWFITQLFRNSPWLVILFIVLLALPFEFTLFGQTIRVPDWKKGSSA